MYPQQTSQSPSDILLQDALAHAAEAGFTLSDSCLADLKTLISPVDKLEITRPLDPVRFEIVASEDRASIFGPQVNRLVSLMIQAYAQQKLTDHVLHESTLMAARTWFCPLFPFC